MCHTNDRVFFLWSFGSSLKSFVIVMHISSVSFHQVNYIMNVKVVLNRILGLVKPEVRFPVLKNAIQEHGPQFVRKIGRGKIFDGIELRLYFIDILGEGEQTLVLSDGLVQALQLRTSNADDVVALFHKSLSLDLASLEQPDPETKRQIRCICLKAKSTDRLDVVKRLREIVPAGTTGKVFGRSTESRQLE